MKKLFLTVLLTLTLALAMPVSNALAIDQCDVVGNTYELDLEGNTYALTNWVDNGCTFGPCDPDTYCAGHVELLCPGNVFYTLDWNIAPFDDILIIGGFKAELTWAGLVVYFIPEDLIRTNIGRTTYMTEDEIPALTFEYIH